MVSDTSVVVEGSFEDIVRHFDLQTKVDSIFLKRRDHEVRVVSDDSSYLSKVISSASGLNDREDLRSEEVDAHAGLSTLKVVVEIMESTNNSAGTSVCEKSVDSPTDNQFVICRNCGFPVLLSQFSF